MWTPDLPVVEKIIRAMVVYFFLLVTLRLTGKRQLGQMSSFDLVVLLILSNTVQNAIIGNDNSITGGLIGAVTILGLNYGIARLTTVNKRFERLVEGAPTLLVHNGKVIEEHLRRELITRDELMAALRRQGILTLDEVRVVLLEETGAITAVRRERSPANNPHSPSVGTPP
ncbi:MAG TPA: YetF domain-containing protein [Candidatus Margulisiibacteriota bacterium]|nr:YetF domain-containing protein [Candidatus Margulisiibacteriota bacterium]